MGIKAKNKDKEEDKVIETDLKFSNTNADIKDKLKNISKMSIEEFETMLNTISDRS